MDTLVSFLMVNNVEGLNNFFEYVKNVINELLKGGFIAGWIIPCESLDYGDNSPIDKVSDCHFTVQYTYNEKERNTHWRLEFEFGTIKACNKK